MKLNTRGRYAVMALADMAKFDKQNPISLRDISLSQNISVIGIFSKKITAPTLLALQMWSRS